MKVSETELPGVLLFTPTVHRDDRGFFSRTFDAEVLRSVGLDPDAFIEHSQSRSSKGVIRGLHLRSGRAESKIVRCSHGQVFDVVVDLRPGSRTFGRWRSFDLDGETQESIYIPAGLAHGHQTLTDTADVSYRIDRPHDPTEDVTIAFDDPDLAIGWPLSVTLMSDRDRNAPRLAAVVAMLREVSR